MCRQGLVRLPAGPVSCLELRAVASDGSPPSPRAQMPVQPPGKDTEEMEAEGDSAAEMNGEEEESEEERSGSQTESEEESSEMDDEDYERRRGECVNEMLDLEKQFSELKEKLFRERLSQLRVRLEEVGAERAPEYTEPLGGLQRSLKIRIQVAGIYKGFCLDVIRNKYECELQGAKQHLEGELQERIQRLEEDRQSLDISSGEAALGPALSVPTPWRGLRCPARPRGVEEDLLLGVTVGTKWNQAQKGPGPVPGVEWRLTKNGSPYPPRPLLSFQNGRCHSDAPAHPRATVPSASTAPVFVWGPKEARIVIVPLSPKQLKKPGSPKCSDLSPWPAQLCHLGLSSASKPRARVPSTAAGGRGGVRDGLARVKGPGYKGRVPRGLWRLAPNSGSGGTEWWDDRLHAGSSAKTWDSLPPSKRKKAPLVSGPYIVYMLQEIDILEDWTAIKKARAAVSPQKRKADGP
ncbi:breast cancer metastasis-suppressor 1 isoform X1 [Prionailurus bengalensis]|uniref:breast cancer metastasis-suppressor 1 isoform X1 n=1 Tax=Prionailurus bengalensis TaxID=37029 RepID=UPI001CA99D60|nr:breast cancer metastasis-suppressor 1 isoform X1 [Prionailurus bengalensis]